MNYTKSKNDNVNEYLDALDPGVAPLDPGKTLVLTGGIPFGLFKSERTHTLSPAEGGLTRFNTEETFSGLLLPFFGRTIPDLTENFQDFVEALRRQAEA